MPDIGPVAPPRAPQAGKYKTDRDLRRNLKIIHGILILEHRVKKETEDAKEANERLRKQMLYDARGSGPPVPAPDSGIYGPPSGPPVGGLPGVFLT